MARKSCETINCNTTDLQFQITDIYTPESDYNNKKKRKDLAIRNDPRDPDKINGYHPYELYTLILYGSTAKGESVTLKVSDYEPYFYLKIPNNWSNEKFTDFIDKLKTVKNEKVSYYDESEKAKKEFMTCVISEDYHSHLPSAGFEIVMMKDFWGFKNEKKFSFYKIKVKSYTVFNNLKRYFSDKKRIAMGFKLYGSNLDPMLKFLHDSNIEPCNWIQIKKGNYSEGDPDFSRTQHCFECFYSHIKPLESNKNAPLLIMATDIECTSSHGDFPLAKKDYKKLAVDLVTLARVQCITIDKLSEIIINAFFETQKVGTKDIVVINKLYTKQEKVSRKIITGLLDADCLQKIMHQIDTINKIIGIYNDPESESESDIDESNKSSVPNITKNNEISKCEKNITEILNVCFNDTYPLKGDSIIQIGSTFNVFGSDEIIYKNIISLGGCSKCEGIDVISCESEKDVIMEWKQLIIDQDPDILAGYNTFGFDFKYIAERAEELEIYEEFIIGLGRLKDRKNKLETKLLASSALGENIMYLFAMDGVVSIDMLKVMQRDQKLDSFKLNNVAKTFLGDQKDDLSPKELFQRFLGDDDDRAIIAKYCVQDCALVNRLIHKLKVLENNIGMANVSCVPLNFIFMRGQGIKIFSLVSREAAKDNYVIPVIDKPDMDAEDDGYEGALVLVPEEGIYLDDPITVFDYNSLYPSSMIDRNLSHDTIVFEDDDAEYGHLDNDPNSDVTYNIVKYDLYEGKGDKKVVVGERVCKFAQYKDGRKGTIPKILMNVLAARKFTKALMEYETVICNDGKEYSGIIEENETFLIIKDAKTKTNTEISKDSVSERKDTFNKFELATLDSRQNAYKVTANSIYGQAGSRTSQIYLKDIAACTTARGREMIMTAKKFVEDKYEAEVIYGDTDSIFCKFPNYNDAGIRVYGKEALKIAIKMGQEIEKSIKKIMPLYQNLAYEKVLWPFILLSKKRYVGNLYEKDPEKKKLKSMGLAIKRRDYAPIVKIIYGGIIEILINKSNLSESIRFLRESLQNLIEGKMSLENLIVSKTLKGSYKDPTKIAHKVLADRIGERDEGNKPMINERVPYVYILLDPGVEVKLQGDRIESPDYIREHNLTPDYKFYITNQLKKPISQLYTLCVDQLPGYDFEPGYWYQMEEELKDKVIYQDPKKCKSRIQALKMKVVEELLFKEFIDALTPPKERKTKQTKVTKKSQAESVAVSGSGSLLVPNVKDEGESSETPIKKRKIAIKLNNNILDIKYQCKKKKFKITVKITSNKIELWNHEITGEIKGKKISECDKLYQLNKATEDALEYIRTTDSLKDLRFNFKSDDYFVSILKENKGLSESDFIDMKNKVESSKDIMQFEKMTHFLTTRKIIEINSEVSYLINI